MTARLWHLADRFGRAAPTAVVLRGSIPPAARVIRETVSS